MRTRSVSVLVVGILSAVALTHAQEQKSSYMPVVIAESFTAVMARMTAAKPEIARRHQTLLQERYDLSDRPAVGVTMSRGKAVQTGVRAKIPTGQTWERLGALTPEQIKTQGAFPKGFLPLPHPNHPEGGMVFPKFHIEEIKRQEGRDLIRFDLDFDLHLVVFLRAL